MKFRWNAVIQTIGTIGQAVNVISPMLPGDAQLSVAVTLAAVQGVTAMIAHFRNPNGTPATLPYIPRYK